jgi:succinate dehydrogenase / fumarate reductase cytochrome b subunit
MQLNLSYFRSSLGKKLLMAVTGFIFFGFVIAHMLGNLQIFLGPEKINSYAKFLKDLGGILWVARITLLISFIIHVITSIQLTIENNIARGTSYAYQNTIQATLSSRTMRLSALVVLSFVIYHLLHFTLGITNPDYLKLEYNLNGVIVHDVYSMVVQGFLNPIVSGSYIFAMLLLAMHLSHGISSMIQTLGIDNPKHNPMLKSLANGFAAVIFIGNSSIPLCVLTGIIPASSDALKQLGGL